MFSRDVMSEKTNSSLPANDENFLPNENSNWANFEAFPSSIDQHSETTSPVIEDDWAEFQSNTAPPLESSDNNEDAFGDYSEVQSVAGSEFIPLPEQAHSEQIHALLSTCFPLEPSAEADDLAPFALPNFTTYDDRRKQIPCLQQSLTLWKCLSTISNDPVGIRYQWRKSKLERLFHQTLGVQIPIVVEDCTENQIHSDNAFVEIESLSPLTNSSSIDDNLFEMNTPCVSSTIERASRNSSPNPSSQAAAIKTTDLIPGSSAFSTDEPKPVVNALPRFTFMNPKTLMARESTIGSN